MEIEAERGEMCLGGSLGPLSLSGGGSGSARTTNPGYRQAGMGSQGFAGKVFRKLGCDSDSVDFAALAAVCEINKSSTSAAPLSINLSSVPNLRGRHCFSLTLSGLRLAPTSKKTKTPRLPWWLGGKESACQCRRHGFDP